MRFNFLVTFGVMNDKLKLSQLNSKVKEALSAAFPASVWVIGEISEIKIQANGHCYLVLVEKEEHGDRIVAQARATIWSYTFRMLRPFFETTTGQLLTEGIKILVSASVEFHELYGYSLNIRDIDPTYTLGDMAKRRRDIIRRLTDEGVINMNKELELPLVPQRIAVISSPTAAGYQDFVDQLTQNRYGYRFYLRLFPAVMQGELAAQSIITALDTIFGYDNFFDCVVIIRGGGAVADLSCFDNYDLAYHITQFPLPVLTGIGHEKDESIVDLVAHTKLKTPTAVAEFLIDGAAVFDAKLNELELQFTEMVEAIIAEEKLKLERWSTLLAPLVREQISDSRHQLMQLASKVKHGVQHDLQLRGHMLDKLFAQLHLNSNKMVGSAGYTLDKYLTRMVSGSRNCIANERSKVKNQSKVVRQLLKSRFSDESHRLGLAAQRLRLVDPQWLLQRGYSITLLNGKAVKSKTELKPGEVLTTRLSDGIVVSTVSDIE